MLGYLTAKQAKKEGFTHHGSYYGIPVWMSDDPEAPMICTKWAPLELAMTIGHYIEGLLWPLLHPDEEPLFMLKMGAPIE